MRDFEELFELIGLQHNEFQFMEGTPEQADLVTVFYPGFMTKASIVTYKGEEAIIDALQKTVEEHLLDVTKTLKLIKTFRRTYGK